MWECVNRQTGQFGVTVNFYKKDLETEKLYLEIFRALGDKQMPVRDWRIGEIIDGYDRWWRSDDSNGPDSLAEAVRTYGLPWLDEVRTLEEQAETWFARRILVDATGYNGPLMISLALTLYRMEELGEACEVLRKPVTRTALPSSVERVAMVRAWLGCDQCDLNPAPP